MKDLSDVYDTDLPALNRTEANCWKAKFFEASKELTKANKGIRRLRSQKAYLEQCIIENRRYYQNTIREMIAEEL